MRDHKGHPLQEHQVRDIVKYLDEIGKGWHTLEWFTDMLRMPGADKQVARYIIDSVKWGISTRTGNEVRIQEFEQYLEDIESSKYPDISLDVMSISSLVKSKATLPLEARPLIDTLELVLENLKFAERLDEPLSSIHELKTRVSGLYDEINAIIGDQGDKPVIAQVDASETLTEASFDCPSCGDESFDWLKPEEKKDVVMISSIEERAVLQHQLRHLIIELHDAVTNNRNRTYLFSLEDDIEHTHYKLDKLRRQDER